jgi:hypothetical protein
VAQGGDAITLFDAVARLGLKLEPQNAPIPVIVVDRVSEKPTDNLPGVTQSLPSIPTEFEVADIKPSQPGTKEDFQLQPSGRIDARGVTMKELIQQAWLGIDNDDMLVGGPKWLDVDRFDIVAKSSSAASVDGHSMDIDYCGRC